MTSDKLALSVGGDNAETIMTNFAGSRGKIPEHIRLVTYELLLNTLPTACRMPKIIRDRTCVLCRVGLDIGRHIFGECDVARKAYEMVCLIPEFRPLRSLTFSLCTLSLAATMTPQACCLVMVFNFSVWLVHQKLRHRDCAGDRLARAICDLAEDNAPRNKKRKKCKP